MIKVILVEDSPVALTLLKKLLDSAPDIEVVGCASTGVEALEMIPKVNPDVICTDLHMPKMNGLELTTEVMALYPRPILIISASVQEEDTHHVFQLLEAGAVDIFPKPRAGQPKDYELIKQPLINKIKVLAGVRVFSKPQKYATPVKKEVPFMPTSMVSSKIKMVAIGASTGGPQALQEIFSKLPVNFPVPIICVQHISEGFLQGLIDWLTSVCKLKLVIAQSGVIPQPGNIYFPPEGQHLELDSSGKFFCSHAPQVGGHRPSITVTLKSVARVYGSTAIGILLTGMGKDGAEGMKAIAAAGGLTIAQDQGTSVVFGMPKEAIALGGVKEVLPLQAIAPFLLKKMV
ncbi:MAG: chemotaxis-specific protein-glutamate methyltransferase CheB [Gomphosphaeria aponina SAG 52.96 = DSM 107014]|uniref:Protein-glutamate methylesterase/protein-glutamine glutaminase n=1 Tax=Gomphosphaeria aponina SAG 52.96 = DSM 107014 TaxID=1521640 RepID=A0A941GP88_9CHRO|nr:chemotaxis-specific protein-glutamate methyltransferase CheB [Gomphosphaeria aponina SAG 52.96 = DSM 107014]